MLALPANNFISLSIPFLFLLTFYRYQITDHCYHLSVNNFFDSLFPVSCSLNYWGGRIRTPTAGSKSLCPALRRRPILANRLQGTGNRKNLYRAQFKILSTDPIQVFRNVFPDLIVNHCEY